MSVEVDCTEEEPIIRRLLENYSGGAIGAC